MIWNERARPALADVVRGQRWISAAAELDAAGVGREHAGHQVEQGGLAGAVRADQRVDLARVDREAGVGDGADAAEMLRDACDLEHRPLAAFGQQERRQRQALVDAALAHRRRLLGRRPPAALERAPDADQPVRRIEHEADEHQAEPQQPVRGPDREQLAEQDEEQRAEGGPQDVVHAADHDHRQQLAGERHRDAFGRDEIGLEPEQRAGSAVTIAESTNTASW